MEADALPPTQPRKPPRPESILVRGEGVEPLAPGIWNLHGQGNSIVFEIDQGLVMVDAGPGGRVTDGMIKALREVSQAPVYAICFSHGHLGYNAGLPQWLAHAHGRGEPAPRVIAHANVLKRMARYQETLDLQTRMAEIQFRRELFSMQGKFPLPMPTESFEHALCLGDRAGRHVELLWAPSETDDAIAIWHPQQRLLYSGPSMIDSIPNVGTPFRTQRDPVRWADTLERLALLKPVTLVREFGPSLVGEAQVAQVLSHTAQALRWVRAEVVRLINAGMNQEDMLAAIEFPPELFDVPWMSPTYSDPYWIARDVYKSENGWWDRNPTSLHPAAPARVSAALAAAITDKQAVLDQARALHAQGEIQLALHVVDLLATLRLAGAEMQEARRLKADWMRERATQTRSYISKSIYHAAASMMQEGETAKFGIT